LKNKILVTGGAGFIGSHLVDRLIKKGNRVIVLDNLSSGRKEFIQQHLKNPSFKFIKNDLLTDSFNACFRDVNEVWHLAANPDVRAALKNPKVDLEQNILVTYNVLEAMRLNTVKKIIFTSTSTIYGEAKKIPTPEDYAPLIPISLYGATKLACEGLISAYCHTSDLEAVIFRLANIVGPRSTHGVVYDFFNKLNKNPNELEILGDGNQKKSYLYMDDCINAMLIGAKNAKERVDIFNIGAEDWIRAEKIAKIVCEEMKLNPKFRFTGGKRGWKGDVPLMRLDISRIKKLGWKPECGCEEALRKSIRWYRSYKST